MTELGKRLCENKQQRLLGVMFTLRRAVYSLAQLSDGVFQIKTIFTCRMTLVPSTKLQQVWELPVLLQVDLKMDVWGLLLSWNRRKDMT